MTDTDIRGQLGLEPDATDEEVTERLDAAQAEIAAARASHGPTAAADTVPDPKAWPPPEQVADPDGGAGASVGDQWTQHRLRGDGSLVLIGPHQTPPPDSDPTGNPTG